MKRSISKWITLLGILLVVLTYILIPTFDLLPANIIGIDKKDIVGFTMVYIIPILGTIGCIFSIYEKKWLYLLLNFVLAFSFYIFMYLAFTIGR